jgi:hypothetical protein
MLEVGNGAMTDPEYKAHFSLWAAAKSPLIMGNDLRAISPADLSILSNAAVIAVSQDPSGSSASRRWMYSINATSTNNQVVQMWSGSLKSTTGDQNDMVVLLINGNNETTITNASLADIFVDNGPGKALFHAEPLFLGYRSSRVFFVVPRALEKALRFRFSQEYHQIRVLIRRAGGTAPQVKMTW